MVEVGCVSSGANSPASLSMYSAKRLVKDDLSKWESDKDAGDPEAMAESRTKAFRDAKILAIGTGLLKANCRTTRAFLAGTQEHFQCAFLARIAATSIR